MKCVATSLLALSALVITALPFCAQAEDKPMDDKQVEAIVKRVIAQNPEIIMKTLMDYQEKQELDRVSKAAVNLSKMQDRIIHDPHSPSIGNPKGDVTVVEFFDYHCGYCKRFFPEIPKLLREDKNLRIVFKEFPILSPDSILASQAALAVYRINPSKYFDYHILLMKSAGAFTEESLTEQAKQIGIDEDNFKKVYNSDDVKKDLENNKKLAESLSVTATPTLIVGTEVIPGAIDYETLKGKIDTARNGNKQKKAAGE